MGWQWLEEATAPFFGGEKSSGNGPHVCTLSGQSFPAMIEAATEEEQGPAAMRMVSLGGTVWWLTVALRLSLKSARILGDLFLIMFDGPRCCSCLVVLDGVGMGSLLARVHFGK